MQPSLQPPVGPLPHAAVVNIETFGQNLYLMIGAAIVVLIAAALLLLAVIALKWRRWNKAAERLRRQAEAARLDPDGRRLPPAGRGVCDQCQRAFEKVFFLPTGRRACPDCYDKLRRAAPAAAGR